MTIGKMGQINTNKSERSLRKPVLSCPLCKSPVNTYQDTTTNKWSCCCVSDYHCGYEAPYDVKYHDTEDKAIEAWRMISHLEAVEHVVLWGWEIADQYKHELKIQENN